MYGWLIIIAFIIFAGFTIIYQIESIEEISKVELVNPGEYKVISEQEYIKFARLSELYSFKVASALGMNDSERENLFIGIFEEEIENYLRSRGIYNIEVTITKNPYIKRSGDETVINYGKYTIIVRKK